MEHVWCTPLDVCGYAQSRRSLTVTALQMASRLSRVRFALYKTSWLAVTAVKGTMTYDNNHRDAV
jgi:phage baseplate assembly protein gpV